MLTTEIQPPPCPPPWRLPVRYCSRWRGRIRGATTGLITPSRRASTKPTATPMKTGLLTPKTVVSRWWGRPPTTERAALTPTVMDGLILTVVGVCKTAQMPLQVNPHNGWTPTTTDLATTSKGTKATTAPTAAATPRPTASVVWIRMAMPTPTLTPVA